MKNRADRRLGGNDSHSGTYIAIYEFGFCYSEVFEFAIESIVFFINRDQIEIVVFRDRIETEIVDYAIGVYPQVGIVALA